MSNQSELDRWCVAFLDGDVSAGQFKRAITDWHKQEIAKARINENEMYMQEADRHYFPAGPNDPYIPLVQFHERIGELTLKEYKEK